MTRLNLETIYSPNALAKIHPFWRVEISEWLRYINEKNQSERFIPRLTPLRPRQRDETLAEIYSAFFIERVLRYPVIDWERKTVGGRDVDLVVQSGVNEIYCEVKSPGWESELTDEEKKSTRKEKPKYINAEARSFAPWLAIRSAVKKATPKFINGKQNLVIVNDDLFISPASLDYQSQHNVDIALRYSGSTIYGGEKGLFCQDAYRIVGGVLLIQSQCRSDGIHRLCRLELNPNASEQLEFEVHLPQE
ncbi:MAG TPA: hypothetical protein PKB12_03590 [Elusimicrobiota bacterium]|nr:hypothetical protein [Elusimicrobiota bacterium]